MLTSTNLWMSFAGIVFLVAGVVIRRSKIRAARGLDKFIVLGPVFFAASLAAFAPEHFHGPDFIKGMVPKWMPLHMFWVYLVGCALIAAAIGLTVRKFERLSATLLGSMFFLFVCLIYLPSVIRHPKVPLAWAIMFRDLSFAGGAWALAGAQRSKWMVAFGRIVIAIAAIFFAFDYFFHPHLLPGVPLQLETPTWIPLPAVWGYLTGAILLVSGIPLLLNIRPRIASASIGVLMTVLTAFPYLLILIHALGGSDTEINTALNNIADTLLYAGAALAVALASPGTPARVEFT
jgi:uncharacterized membrane protein